MTLAFADGTKYSDDVQYLLGNPISSSEDLSSSNKSPKEDQVESPEINYDHHVPLLASAKMDNTGIYIDSRLKGQLSPEEEYLLNAHEYIEKTIMDGMEKHGLSGPKAYTIAHPIATAGETEISKAMWGEEGHEKYKDRMRQFASIASQPSDKERASDAHTTYHGLDDAELGNSYKVANMLNPNITSDLTTEGEPGLMQLQGGPAAGPGKASAITIKPTGKYGDYGVKSKDFEMFDEKGESVGTINASQHGKSIHINGIYSNEGPNSYGPSTMRNVLRQLREHFPEATEISGTRVSGARSKAGNIGFAKSSLTGKKIDVDPIERLSYLEDELDSILSRPVSSESRSVLTDLAQDNNWYQSLIRDLRNAPVEMVRKQSIWDKLGKIFLSAETGYAAMMPSNTQTEESEFERQKQPIKYLEGTR